jgi:sulfate adenylyltransferase (ADP) / ATP adenylyltransferase
MPTETDPPARPPGWLWQEVLARTQTALQTGALQSIPTDCTWVEQAGTQFMVRVLANLVRKDAARKAAPKAPNFNPFLPPEPDLYVADLSPTHAAVLNKFNVVDHHLLIITRAFESQDSWLTPADFAALALALAELDGLAFYNGGAVAGASQRHKHLQIVPLPLVDSATATARLPIEPLLARATYTAADPADTAGRSPDLPFVHGLARLPVDWLQSPERAAGELLRHYHQLAQAIGLDLQAPQPTAAYNLLATREWMLLVRRSHPSFDHIEINALGFAGSFFVRNAAELARLQHHSPLGVLAGVTVPWAMD